MMRSLYLAGCYLRYQRVKTLILVLAVTLIVYLPASLQVIVDRTADELVARARTTPLLVGRKGSSLDLVLNSLYFEAQAPEPIRMRQVTRVRDSGLADPIPLYVRFEARTRPLVGTTLDYFDFRGHAIDKGRRFAIVGECVLGALAAEDLDLGPGDTLDTTPEILFDLAGAYSLRMKVVGVLKRSYGPDDEAVFVDIKTSWIVEGLGHGHQDLTRKDVDESVILKKEKGTRIANAKVFTAQEITEKNIASFHFHGSPDEFPLTAVLAVPHDEKSRVLLMGRYLGRDETCQIVVPTKVMEDLLATVVKVRSFVLAAVLLVSAATVVTMVLVFLLSLRLRQREIETMRKIGCSRLTVAALLACEIAVVLAVGLVIAGALAWATAQFGPSVIRALLF